MENIFLGSLAFGVCLNLALLLLRVLGGRSGGAKAAIGFDPESDTFPILLNAINRAALANFLTFFGATGYLMYLYSPIPSFMVAMVAVLPGFAAAQLIHWLTTRQSPDPKVEG